MKLNLAFMHRDLVRRGEYEEARLILRLLRKGILHLGSNDMASWNVEIMLQEAGLFPWYSNNYLSTTFRLYESEH